MNVLYCGDSNIADGVILSVLSLLKNSRQPLAIYILTAGIKTEKKEYRPLGADFLKKLNSLLKEANEENCAYLKDITDMFTENPPTANMETRFTPLCMLRLYADLQDFLPDKILYLDNDVICRKDCSEFYNQNIDGVEICGVLDYYGRWFFRNQIYRADYMNSGVMLLNLKKIRSTGLFEKCRNLCAKEKMFMPDQSAINKLSTSKKLCKRKYNEQRALKSDTVFQHFTTSFRIFPWFHAVSVKPWDIKKVHEVLKIHEYDALFAQYEEWKSKEITINAE